jgi:hypothetical protein
VPLLRDVVPHFYVLMTCMLLLCLCVRYSPQKLVVLSATGRTLMARQYGKMPAQRPLKSLQCQYPAGCPNGRTVKRNGERHWVCKSHRDRQKHFAARAIRTKPSRQEAKGRFGIFWGESWNCPTQGYAYISHCWPRSSSKESCNGPIPSGE